jgi:hypothetical protein
MATTTLRLRHVASSPYDFVAVVDIEAFDTAGDDAQLDGALVVPRGQTATLTLKASTRYRTEGLTGQDPQTTPTGKPLTTFVTERQGGSIQMTLPPAPLDSLPQEVRCPPKLQGWGILVVLVACCAGMYGWRQWVTQRHNAGAAALCGHAMGTGSAEDFDPTAAPATGMASSACQTLDPADVRGIAESAWGPEGAAAAFAKLVPMPPAWTYLALGALGAAALGVAGVAGWGYYDPKLTGCGLECQEKSADHQHRRMVSVLPNGDNFASLAACRVFGRCACFHAERAQNCAQLRAWENVDVTFDNDTKSCVAVGNDPAVPEKGYDCTNYPCTPNV